MGVEASFPWGIGSRVPKSTKKHSSTDLRFDYIRLCRFTQLSLIIAFFVSFLWVYAPIETGVCATLNGEVRSP